MALGRCLWATELLQSRLPGRSMLSRFPPPVAVSRSDWFGRPQHIYNSRPKVVMPRWDDFHDCSSTPVETHTHTKKEPFLRVLHSGIGEHQQPPGERSRGLLGCLQVSSPSWAILETAPGIRVSYLTDESLFQRCVPSEVLQERFGMLRDPLTILIQCPQCNLQWPLDPSPRSLSSLSQT